MKGIKFWVFSYRKKEVINRIIAILLCVSLITGIIPITQKVYAADDKQYVVLVLDTAGNTNFMKSENEIAYSAVSPINDVKEAAKGFIESVIASNRNTYVSIISYSDSATLVSDFDNNGGNLYSKIESLYSDGRHRNMKAAIVMAHEQLEKLGNDNSKKTVVLVSPGMTNIGGYNYEGPWDAESEGASWQNPDTGINLYAYANAACLEAKRIKAHAKIYTIGLVGNMNGCPEDVEGAARLFRNTLMEISSGSEYCFMAEDISEFHFSFGELTDIYNGTYSGSGNFAFSSGSKQDYEAEYYYDDLYFVEPAEKYVPSLATMSLCFAMSAFGSNRSDVPLYHNAEKLLKECGYDYIETSDDFKQDVTTPDTIAAIAGMKNVYYDEGAYTIIAVAIRGANYYSEWGGNFKIGENGDHEGFSEAAQKVLDFLNDYIADSKIEIKNGIKIWITGFSRGGAVANLLAGKLSVDKEIGKDTVYTIVPQNIYAYCFEPPRGVSLEKAREDEINPATYKNIHNVLNLNDLVPRVAMQQWGFLRYGKDEKVILRSDISNEYKNNVAKMMKRYESLIANIEENEKPEDFKDDNYKSYIDITEYEDVLNNYIIPKIKSEFYVKCSEILKFENKTGNVLASIDYESEWRDVLYAFLEGKKYCTIGYGTIFDFRDCSGYGMYENAYEFYKTFLYARKYAYGSTVNSLNDELKSQYVSKIDLFRYYNYDGDKTLGSEGILKSLLKNFSSTFEKKQDYFYDEVVRFLANSVGNREKYSDELQAGICTLLKYVMSVNETPLNINDIKLALNLVKMSALLHCIFQKELINIETVYDYLYNTIIVLAGVKEVDLLEEMSKEELTDFREGLWNLAEIIVDKVIHSKEEIARVYTLIRNINLLGYAHYPELCLAWLQSQDPNYEKGAKRLFCPSSYRIIRINCPVDVAAYDSQGIKVAEIINDEPQYIEDSILTCTYTDDGEKIIYLPVDETFNVIISAREDCMMDVSINEFENGSSYNRVTNYFDISMSEGETISVQLPKEFYVTENETENYIYEDNIVVKENSIITPSLEVFDDAANELLCSIVVINDNESGGVIVGGGEYIEGSYATVRAAEYEDCSFVGWYEGVELVSTEREYRFRVMGDRNLTARFDGETQYGKNGIFTAELTASEGGFIYGEKEITALDGYPFEICAVPYDGYEFVGWETDENCIIENSEEWTTKLTLVDTDVMVMAQFKKIESNENDQGHSDDNPNDINDNQGENENQHSDVISGSEYRIVSDGIDIIYETETAWNGGYNGKITINNNTGKDLSEWKLSFELPTTVTNIWNAQLIENGEKKYAIKDVGWNSVIPVGTSVSIGFTAMGDIVKEPDGFIFEEKAYNSGNDGCTIEFVKTNEWDGGCTGEIVITNISDKTIKDWSLEFDCSGKVNGFWNGTLISNEGDRYIIENAGYNYSIEPGISAFVGINLTVNNDNELPNAFCIIRK